MLGVGVGFDTRGAGNMVIKKPTGEPTPFVVEDTREGWVDSLKAILMAYEGGEPII